jgi:hypothetical protein
MGEHFRLDPDGLDAANREFLSTGEAFGSAFDDLVAVLDDHHGCWGDDDIGKAFAKNYVTSAEEVRTASKEAVDGIYELHEGVDESSTTFQGVDEESAIQIDNSVNDK